MTRYRIRITCVVAAGLGLAASCGPGPSTEPRECAIQEKNCLKLRMGMTRAEVERLLGGPPRNDCRKPVKVRLRGAGKSLMKWHPETVNPGDPPPVRVFTHPHPGELCGWLSDEVLVVAWFGPDGRLFDWFYEPAKAD